MRCARRTPSPQACGLIHAVQRNPRRIGARVVLRYRAIAQSKGMGNMFDVLTKSALNITVTRMDVYAPLVARKAEAGQFVIVRAGAESERIPLTIADFDRDAGSIALIFQVVGAGTIELNSLAQGDCLADVAGPLGKATETEGLRKVCVVGGGVGCAIALPIAKKLHTQGAVVHSVVGFRTRELVILEADFQSISDEYRLMTDDGSYGEKGLVTNALEALINAGNVYDEVIAIGPLIMMKFVSLITKKYGIKTVVSMNPIMIDGTGMCGGCRLTVGGQTKFACVDGPDFDGHLVDFDEALRRGEMYREFEQHARAAACNLFAKEGN